jgi:hypothetical protein
MRIHTLLLLFSVALLLCVSCKTEDVIPTVVLEASQTGFDYNSGKAEVFAVLNGPVNASLAISIAFEGTAEFGKDYAASAEEIIITKGKDRGKITLTGIFTGDTAIKTVQIRVLSEPRYIIGQKSSIALDLQDCQSDRDGDGIPDCDDECPDEPGPIENNGCPWLGLIINEVLYDPPTGIAGDSNGDGIRQPQEDEFIELYNSNPDLDISGYTISDNDGVRHVFPPGTIVPSKSAVVVFGGGNPTGAFGGAIVQTASTGLLSFNRGGDVITVRDNQGQAIGVFDINLFIERAASSYSRNPDVKGEFELHERIPEAGGALFSPGTQINGTPFN